MHPRGHPFMRAGRGVRGIHKIDEVEGFGAELVGAAEGIDDEVARLQLVQQRQKQHNNLEQQILQS